MNAARLGLKAEAPSQAPSTAGSPASRPRPTRRRSRACAASSPSRHGRDDRQPLGGVVQGEAHDQRGAERQRADGVGGPDGQALAEVVQPDAQRHEEGQPPRAGPVGLLALLAPPQAARRPPPAPDRRPARPGTPAPRLRRPASPEPANSVPSSRASMPRKPSSPSVSAIRNCTKRGSIERIQGSQSMPMATGITPTYRPTSAIRPKKPTSASGVSAATSIEAVDRSAGGGHQRDLVGLALDPRVVDRDRAGPQPPDVARWSG